MYPPNIFKLIKTKKIFVRNPYLEIIYLGIETVSNYIAALQIPYILYRKIKTNKTKNKMLYKHFIKLPINFFQISTIN